MEAATTPEEEYLKALYELVSSDREKCFTAKADNTIKSIWMHDMNELYRRLYDDQGYAVINKSGAVQWKSLKVTNDLFETRKPFNRTYWGQSQTKSQILTEFDEQIKNKIKEHIIKNDIKNVDGMKYFVLLYCAFAHPVFYKLTYLNDPPLYQETTLQKLKSFLNESKNIFDTFPPLKKSPGPAEVVHTPVELVELVSVNPAAAAAAAEAKAKAADQAAKAAAAEAEKAARIEHTELMRLRDNLLDYYHAVKFEKDDFDTMKTFLPKHITDAATDMSNIEILVLFYIFVVVVDDHDDIRTTLDEKRSKCMSCIEAYNQRDYKLFIQRAKETPEYPKALIGKHLLSLLDKEDNFLTDRSIKMEPTDEMDAEKYIESGFAITTTQWYKKLLKKTSLPEYTEFDKKILRKFIELGCIRPSTLSILEFRHNTMLELPEIRIVKTGRKITLEAQIWLGQKRYQDYSLAIQNYVQIYIYTATHSSEYNMNWNAVFELIYRTKNLTDVHNYIVKPLSEHAKNDDNIGADYMLTCLEKIFNSIIWNETKSGDVTIKLIDFCTRFHYTIHTVKQRKRCLRLLVTVVKAVGVRDTSIQTSCLHAVLKGTVSNVKNKIINKRIYLGTFKIIMGSKKIDPLLGKLANLFIIDSYIWVAKISRLIDKSFQLIFKHEAFKARLDYEITHAIKHDNQRFTSQVSEFDCKQLTDLLLRPRLTIEPIPRPPLEKYEVENLIILWGANTSNYNDTSGRIGGQGQAKLMDGRMSETGWNKDREKRYNAETFAVGHGDWEQGIITVDEPGAVRRNQKVFERLVARVKQNPSIRISVAGSNENVYSLGTGIAIREGAGKWWYKIQLGIMWGLKKLQDTMKFKLPAFTFEGVLRGKKTVEEWIKTIQVRVTTVPRVRLVDVAVSSSVEEEILYSDVTCSVSIKNTAQTFKVATIWWNTLRFEKIDDDIIKSDLTENGRGIIGTILRDRRTGKRIAVFSIHCPHTKGGKLKSLKSLKSLIETELTNVSHIDEIILMGDFNEFDPNTLSGMYTIGNTVNTVQGSQRVLDHIVTNKKHEGQSVTVHKLQDVLKPPVSTILKPNLKVMTWNVQHNSKKAPMPVHYMTQAQKIAYTKHLQDKFIQDEFPDILAIQEVGKLQLDTFCDDIFSNNGVEIKVWGHKLFRSYMRMGSQIVFDNVIYDILKVKGDGYCGWHAFFAQLYDQLPQHQKYLEIYGEQLNIQQPQTEILSISNAKEIQTRIHSVRNKFLPSERINATPPDPDIQSSFWFDAELDTIVIINILNNMGYNTEVYVRQEQTAYAFSNRRRVNYGNKQIDINLINYGGNHFEVVKRAVMNDYSWLRM